MQASFARVGHRAGIRRILSIFSIFSHAITHIRKRNQTQAHTTPASQSELHGNIIEAGIFGILFQRTVTEVRVLQRNCSIKNKCQGINRRIGSRIGKVHLRTVTQAIGHSAHCLAITRPLVCQMPVSIPCIR